MATATGTARRDAAIIGIIGVAHLLSHFFQLSLRPLFPLINAELSISATGFGVLIGVFYATSGLLQTPAGFLVDRIGPRPVLFGGLGLLALSVAGYGLAPNYETMLVLAFLAGAGNSVFHPADYSLINASVSHERTGRAYSVHGVGGHIGFAMAWPVMVALGAVFGWRGAVMAAGLFGLGVTLAFVAMRDHLKPQEAAAHAHRAAESVRSSLATLLNPRIVAFFLFFFAFAFGIIGLQSFSAPALTRLSGLSFELSSAILTVLLVGTPLGILIGGVVADSFPRHTVIAAAGFAIAALLMLSVPLIAWPVPLLFVLFAGAGLMLGIALPSRDMVVRSATPKGSTGKVFGFVYSGLDAGASLGPIALGWLLDRGRPGLLFVTAALVLLLGALLIRTPAALLAGRTRAETRA